MEKLESDLENFVRLCHLHEKVAKLEQALAEKDNVIIALQKKIAYYDWWLSNGVYYTNDEFLERVLKPRQQLMEKAVRFSECLNDDCKCTIQRLVIEDLQKRVEELIDHRNNFHREVVEWRGIEFDNVCTECDGSGYKVYGNTTTYHHGAGGQVITTSVCNTCWGSGDKSRPWTSWLQIEQQAQKIARLENGLGCSRSHPHEDMNQICELRTEVARLNNELSQRTNLEGSAPCWNSAHMKQIATLREALGKIVKIRFLLGNDPKLNPAYEMGEIAQQALKESAI